MNTKFVIFVLVQCMLILSLLGRPSEQKNVLFIAVDDLKPLLNCYGFEYVHSPNIDQLAQSGSVFTRAYCQQALCGPSRVSLLTGYYPDRLGIYGMGPVKYQLRSKYPDILTLPQYFKNNGYQTIGMGKVFDPRNVEGDWQGPQDVISWTQFFGKNPFHPEVGGPKGHYHDPQTHALKADLAKEARAQGLTGKELQLWVRENGGGPAVECFDVPDDAYQDGAIATRAIEQLDVLKKTGKPFFLAVGFLKPHLPFVAPKKYWDLYDRKSLKIEGFQDYPAGAPKCAQTDYIEARTYSGVPNEGRIASEIQQELFHGYLACVSYVDAQIGKIISKLKSTGLYDNTIIVLWGDHGFHLGDKQIWGKHTNYEQATRVPLIIANAGVDAGIVRQASVNTIDIFPTLCELSGLPIPAGLDGRSLKPILKGEIGKINQYAASIYPHSGYWGVTVRTEQFRYVGWFKGSESEEYHGVRLLEEPHFTELYDYGEDALESVNLSGAEAYEVIERQLRLLLSDHVSYTQSRQFKR